LRLQVDGLIDRAVTQQPYIPEVQISCTLWELQYEASTTKPDTRS